MTHKGVLQTESKTRWESLETQSPLRSAADRCAVADHPSVMLPRKDVIYPNQRQKGVFYFTANPKVFARARLSGTPHMEQKIERSRSKCKSLTQQKLFLNSLLNDAFLWVPPPKSKVSHYVLESLLWSQACFPWCPICLSCCDRGPGLLSFLSDSSITHLCLPLSLHQNNAVPEWISMSFTLGGTLSLLYPDTREEDMI